MRKLGLLWIAIIGASIAMTGCGKMDEPNFKNIDNISMGSIGKKQSAVHLDAHYFNPNKSKIILKRAHGDAWLDGVYLGKFTVDSLVRIGAFSDFTIPVQLNLDMANFLVNTALAYVDKEVLVKIDGIARVGKGIFFVNYPVHFEGKQNLRKILKQ